MDKTKWHCMLVTVLACLGSVTIGRSQVVPYPPQVVANVALIGQGNAISPTTLIPFKTNLYRVSMYYEMVATTADCGSSMTVAFQWTDDTRHAHNKQIS